MEHIQALLNPIQADKPCGDSIRYSPEFDRLVAARQKDDETLPTGVWQSTPRRADWEDATSLTQTLSKDLVIMSWLGEAWIRTRGLTALPDSLALATLARRSCTRKSKTVTMIIAPPRSAGWRSIRPRWSLKPRCLLPMEGIFP